MLLARRPTWVRPPAVRGNGTGASASGAASQASPAPPCPASFWDAGVRSAGDSNILVRLPEFDICEAQITSQLAPFAMTPGEITALLYGARSRRTSQHCPIIPSYGHFPVDVTSVQLDWRQAPHVSASGRLETGAATRNPPEAPSSGGLRRGRQLARRHAQNPTGWKPIGLDVVATALQIGEQRRECGAIDDVRAVVGTGAVPHSDHIRKIGGYLHAAGIGIACFGFPPDGTRQVSHCHYSSRSASCFR